MRATRSERVLGMVGLCLCVCVGALRAEEPVVSEPVAAAPAKISAIEEAFSQMELLAEVIVQVRRHYVEEKSLEELIYGALDGMLRGLDPHSEFLDADEYAMIQEDTKASYGGLGLRLSLKKGVLTVVAPVEGSPAFEAGIQAGDRILEVDGTSLHGVAMSEIVHLMRGEVGTPCMLRVLSHDSSDPHEVSLTRAEVGVLTVVGTRMVCEGVGYTRVTQFSSPTSGELLAAMTNLQTNDLRAFILDLRGNPGGLLTSAVEVSELLLAKGKDIVSTKGRRGVEMQRRSQLDSVLGEIPMVVLINGGSASASEIVAGAMQDHRRAVLFGETSYGKGSVQSVISTQSDESTGIRMTTAYYYTPAGRLIHGTGIDPDIVVPMRAGVWRQLQSIRARGGNEQEADDPQLERATEFLRALLVYQGEAAQ
jgi:carboxyl-terminal processing protease